jgi:putative bacteriocin precursor
MKRLGKKIHNNRDTIEAYCSCGCSCEYAWCDSCATCRCVIFPLDLTASVFFSNGSNHQSKLSQVNSSNHNSSYYSQYNY